MTKPDTSQFQCPHSFTRIVDYGPVFGGEHVTNEEPRCRLAPPEYPREHPGRCATCPARPRDISRGR